MAFHRNGTDAFITVVELQNMWQSSEVHNWTSEQVQDWLAQVVELKQYVAFFRRAEINGSSLPRYAVVEKKWRQSKKSS